MKRFCGNPLAPPWLQGIPPVDPAAGLEYRYHEYVPDAGMVTLAANAVSRGNIIRTDGDSCFLWAFTSIHTVDSGTAAAYVQFRDPLGRYMSPFPIRAADWGKAQRSIPMLPWLEIKPGLDVLFDCFEQGGDVALVNIVLRGWKVRRVGA